MKATGGGLLGLQLGAKAVVTASFRGGPVNKQRLYKRICSMTLKRAWMGVLMGRKGKAAWRPLKS